MINNSFSLAEEKLSEMTDYLTKKESFNLDLTGVEDYINEEGRELLKSILLGHLKERGLGDIGSCVTGADGIKRIYKRLRTRKMKTLFGEIKIKRIGYYSRNTTSIFPLDASLNLPKINVSYNLQKNLVLELIKSSFDEALVTIKRWTGVTITKCQAKSIVLRASQYFDFFYQINKQKNKTNDTPLLILTSDGKGVVMRYDDLREETKKRAKKQKTISTKYGNLLSKKIKYNSKRMATVASVYEINRFSRQINDIHNEFFNKIDKPKLKIKRPMPMAKRVWAGLKESSEKILNEMFEEALQRDPLLKKEWIVLVDGDMNQINKIKKISRKLGVKLTIICDIIHVLEYVWKAGKALNSNDAETKKWVSKKFYAILEGKSSVAASGMRRSATNRKLTKSCRKPIDRCAQYLLNHSKYLYYNEYLMKGYPIATGIIEGACRHLVKDRMEITGARWSLEGADALLKLRSLKVSGDFISYWKFYEQRQYEDNYKKIYQDASILLSS